MVAGWTKTRVDSASSEDLKLGPMNPCPENERDGRDDATDPLLAREGEHGPNVAGVVDRHRDPDGETESEGDQDMDEEAPSKPVSERPKVHVVHRSPPCVA